MSYEISERTTLFGFLDRVTSDWEYQQWVAATSIVGMVLFMIGFGIRKWLRDDLADVEMRAFKAGYDEARSDPTLD